MKGHYHYVISKVGPEIAGMNLPQNVLVTGKWVNSYYFGADSVMFMTANFIWLIVIFLDILLIFLDNRKRSIHDYLANSIVIKKS